MDTSHTIPAEIMADLQHAVNRAAAGYRDREAMQRACERMDRLREAIREVHGVLDIGVSAIRESRDEE